MDLSELPENTVVLENASTGAKIYLIGTAHISRKSIDDVKSLICRVKPDEVLVELCKMRVGMIDLQKLSEFGNKLQEIRLKGESVESVDIEDYIGNNDTADDNSSTLEYIIKGLKRKEPFLPLLLGLFYRSASKQVKIRPGDEMKAAAYEGLKSGSKIILGDRNINLTLSRTWAALSWWKKITLLFSILQSCSIEISEEDVENLKSSDMITELVNQLSTSYPTLVQTLLTERDLYLTHSLKTKCKGPVVVGVVGMGHVKGIQKYWEEDIDIETITKSPPKSNFGRKVLMLGGFLLVLTIAAIIYNY